VSDDRQFNLFVGLGVAAGAGVVIAFLVALMASKAGEIAAALATVIGGGFVLAAAVVAWKGVQDQIVFQRSIETDKRQRARRELENALTAELMVFSRSIIDATSLWNLRAHKNPKETPQYLPTLVQPRVYPAAISQIGLLDEGWPAMAVITFFGNVLELNEIADEALRGRPTTGQDNATFARRFQMMALNLEQALDGLNADRKFPLLEVDLDRLITPTGGKVRVIEPPPKNLQSLLAILGGRNRGGAVSQ
jgi:hypothetical protein